jgi:asparagine synthase (glutamine-hydrolysing)
MSGICAIITFDGSPVAPEVLTAMTDAAPHRARLGVGRWEACGVAMAQLATRGPAGRAGQPVVRHGLVLVADARVDNRQELVPFLVRRGFLAGEADSTRDAEIIMAAHRCWGDAASQRIIGDFAYLLWDGLRRRLLAARDPLAMRPLYYRMEGRRRALLASEIGQILAAPGVPCAIDERGIVATLAGPYLPADATVYQGISQLAPAHQLVADSDGSRVATFWRPDPDRRIGTDEGAPDLLRTAFERAVSDRLAAYRTPAVSLSGGLDSGSIASMAGWLQQRGHAIGSPLRTYSWAFLTLPDSDERAVSSLITDHYSLAAAAVDGDDAWPLSHYPDHGPDRDDPLIWPYQLLNDRTIVRAAEDGADLLMSGDRGDELLGDWVFDEIGLFRSGHLLGAARDLRRAAWEEHVSVIQAVRRHALKPLVFTYVPALYRLKQRSISRPQWAPWIPNSMAGRVALSDMVRQAREPSRFDGYARGLRHARLFSAQGARIATLAERRRARLGIGFSDPYADRRLIELVLALPQWQVQRRGSPKQLMREAMVGIIPEPALQVVGKRIPVGLFDRAFRDRSVLLVRHLLTGSRAAAEGWLDEAAALATFERYARTGSAANDFWWPLMVEWWLRRWWP